eukprot:scaffold291425_cov23-Prasinocladus_malaysianus.AAC.1
MALGETNLKVFAMITMPKKTMRKTAVAVMVRRPTMGNWMTLLIKTSYHIWASGNFAAVCGHSLSHFWQMPAARQAGVALAASLGAVESAAAAGPQTD